MIGYLFYGMPSQLFRSAWCCAPQPVYIWPLANTACMTCTFLSHHMSPIRSFLIFSTKVVTAEDSSPFLGVEWGMGPKFANGSMGMYSYFSLFSRTLSSNTFCMFNTSFNLGLLQSMSIWVFIHSVVPTNICTSVLYWYAHHFEIGQTTL